MTQSEDLTVFTAAWLAAREDGTIAAPERRRLETLRKELGVSEHRVEQIEKAERAGELQFPVVEGKALRIRVLEAVNEVLWADQKLGSAERRLQDELSSYLQLGERSTWDQTDFTSESPFTREDFREALTEFLRNIRPSEYHGFKEWLRGAYAPISALLFANIIPVLSVIFFDWSGLELVLLYWIETAIVFLVTIPLLLGCGEFEKPITSIIYRSLALVWYTLTFVPFAAFGSVSTVAIFMWATVKDLPEISDLLDVLVQQMDLVMGIAAGMLLIPHIGLVWNALRPRNRRRIVWWKLLYRPHMRFLFPVVFTFLGIILVAISPILMAVVFFVAKLPHDILIGYKESRIVPPD